MGLVPCGCAHATHGTRASFHELYCRCLGKHSQTETGFKTNFLPIKEENSITSYCADLMLKLVKIQWLAKETLFFEALDVYFFMDDDSEHKVDDSDDGRVLDSE